MQQFVDRSFFLRPAKLLGLLCLLALTPAFGIADQGESDAIGDSSLKSNEMKISEPEYDKKSDSELRRSLTSIQYKVTQKEDTEPAFRNKYWDNKKEGLYRCVVCGQSLFKSDTKYKSGTGWPSFWAPIKDTHVGTKTDYHLFYARTEVHCSRCNAHLGHVFNDGPRDKTGKRYCMNSASLKFIPQKDVKMVPVDSKESE